LRRQVDGHGIECRRDAIDIHTFHMTVPAGAGVGFEDEADSFVAVKKWLHD